MYKAGFTSRPIKSHTIITSVCAEAVNIYSKISPQDIAYAQEYQDRGVNAFLKDMPGEIVKISTTPMLTNKLFVISTTITYVKTTTEVCGQSQRCSQKDCFEGTCDCFNMGLIPNKNKTNENKPDFDAVNTNADD